MSVKEFTSQEVQKIRDKVLDVLVTSNDFKYYITKSSLFKQRFYFQSKTSDRESVNEMNIMNSLINKLFWYLHICNQVAHALQYEHQPHFDFTGFENRENKCLIGSNPKKVLKDEIASLQYNILTNDGNYFLSKDWEQLLENIISYFDKSIK